jgi:hypothetical protein
MVFPFLGASLAILHYLQVYTLHAFLQPVLINLGFIAVQLILVSIYFSVKHKKLVNITDQMLGLGDVLFLSCVVLYLSVLNFLFFYVLSLIVVLLAWLLWQTIATPKNKQIPLAGFQSLIFILFLMFDWWVRPFGLTNDNWLLNLIAK